MTRLFAFASCSLVLVCVLVTPASAQLSCPATSTDTTFTAAGLSTDCGTTPCTTKSGINYDGTTNALTLPGVSGFFQSPPSAAISQNVYFAAPGDFDKDGWDDFVAADDADKLYVMRNQTITCGTASCSGSSTIAPTTQAIPAVWWNTASHVRPAAFRFPTDTSGTATPLKACLNPGTGCVSSLLTPMAAGDFNGDGWMDFAEISLGYRDLSNVNWPTAARLFLNTKNCHDASNRPCGIGRTCTGQPANGACSGSGVAGSGTPNTETQLSCTTTLKCPYYMPTFASYDLRAGTAVSAQSTNTSTPAFGKPGDFGPMGHPVQNMVAVDWDGDGDLDILYGHGPGTCPGTLCTTASYKFFTGIDVWLNDCNPQPATRGTNPWIPASKSCPGYVPKFSHTMGGGGCTSGSAACANSDTLFPSTAHNNSTVLPNTNMGFNVANKQVPGFAFVDLDNDSDLDLIVGSPGCCSPAGPGAANAKYRLRVYKNTSSSASAQMLDTANPIELSTSDATHPGFQGGLTGVFVSDFTGDGFPDIITGSDSFGYDGNNGGRTRYWKNTGNSSNPFGKTWPSCATTPATCAGCSSSCNPDATQSLSESCGGTSCTTNLAAVPPQFPDFDMGFLLNYDHDPMGTIDGVFTNGNTSNEFYLFPNRSSPNTMAPCGNVASGPLAIPGSEQTVTSACIAPTATVPAGASITYYLNNENPENWQLACTQTSAGFTPALTGGQCCVAFPNQTGRNIEWKATFDSDTSDGPGVCTNQGNNGSPNITSIAANYTYTAATSHYKAGVIVSDGVSYVGSFTQPGDRGHMYATSAALSTKYYDVGTTLDAQGTRYLYTTNVTGATGVSRIDFDTASSGSATLQSRIGATPAQAPLVLNWVLGPRFGIVNSGVAETKLGAVLDSTPAILNKPYRPNWYTFLSPSERALYDNFATAQATRVPLLLFGSMDGFLHAIITIPTAIGDAHNGKEAWGFVPPFVASNMTADYTASCTPDCATGTLAVTSFPDGSPTLLDFKKANNSVATAAIIGDGQGGTSITALDVTSTIDTAFNTSGPTPLWSWQVGGAAAGKAMSKVGVARSLLGGVEKYVVVAGSGVDSGDPAKGKIVAGYDLETGTLMWQFEMACPLTSDITIFETDDSGEPGSPQIDGFADRAVFADKCGYVYKIDPAQDLAGGWMDNSGYGPISLGTLNGVARYALFSTQSTAGAVGGQRPIVNAIGARADTTTDIVLFFGTGGMEAFDTTLTNEFYAVYAKNGAIRGKVTGNCVTNAGVTKCEKFYGGVVVTPDAVILERSYDAVIGGGTCDFGATHIQSYALNSFATQVFDITQIAGQAIAAVSGPLYGDAGALYFATVSGEVKRIGQPRASTAGQDTTNGTATGMGAQEVIGTNNPFTLMGWRVVL
jgi:type IV pilus assembly protein PilY1